ncbi:DUF485 domain-containing protein [Massilia varians]|uniref:DUF485 domain-containing protein n=1 Tax=Massilia varians TaxID=457921 RepID=UPI0025568D49|nr:DUF485 domain-containing protein [Massilia varians]
MDQDIVRRVKADPNYRKLVTKRSRFGWILTWSMMVVYYGFTLLCAFDKEFMGSRIGAGVMTWGIPLGLFVILFTVVVTAIYVRRANSEYDQLTEAIKANVAGGNGSGSGKKVAA